MRLKYLKFKLKNISVLILLIILITPKAALALLAQEMTQQSIYKAAQEEVDKLKKMVEHQKKMLAHLDSSKVNDMKSKRQALINSFNEVQNILKNTDGITHMIDDFDNKFKARHPDYTSGLKIKDLKSRNDNRDNKWRNTAKAYMQSANKLAHDYNSNKELREKLMEIIKSPDGQTQAIQTIGVLLDHANMMLVRNENTLQGFFTTYLESERDLLDKREQKGKSVLEACGGLKNHKPTVTARKLGI